MSAELLWLLVGVCMAFLAMVGVLVYRPDLLTKTLQKHEKAAVWQEGYDQGVNDERMAAEWDIPEYRIPRRANPYGKKE